MNRSSDLEKIERAKRELKLKYKVKNIKEVEYILDIKVNKVKERIRISQRVYATQMLEKFSMVEYKPQSISLLIGISLSVTDNPETQEETSEMKKISYHKALELLMWL